MLKSKRSKATDISEKVKKEVWARDHGKCVICENDYNVMPNAHIVSRAKGGLGTATNVVTMCTNLTECQCHFKYDNGTAKERRKIEKKITSYMKSIYGPKWKKDNQIYRKYSY